MSESFNLTDEPFIPCLTAHGYSEFGLKETLLQAHDVAEVRDASPLGTLALHRLLLAILHRNFGPTSGKQWRRLWDAGRFPADALAAYFERWRDRFDLFHERHPFFQAAGFTAAERSGVNRLGAEISETNVKFLFSHVADDAPPQLPPPAVARLLVAHQLTAGPGGRGYGASPLSRGLAVLAKGRNLFETLMLNLVRYRGADPIPNTEDDAPVWERDDPAEAAAEVPDGYLDYLTWQCRTIRLHPQAGHVREVSYGPGRMFRPPPESPVFDPMMAYERRADGDKALQLSETKGLWRDSAALLQFAETDVFRGPRCLWWLGQLRAQGDFPERDPIKLSVLGVSSDQAKVFLWRHEELPLPLDYLTDADLVGWLKNAIDLAGEVRKALWAATAGMAAKALAPGESAPDPKRVRLMVEELAPERLYWSRLEVPFRVFLERLAEDVPQRTAYRKQQRDGWFHDTLRTTARAAFDETAGRLDHSARVLRAVVAGGQQLARSLGKIARSANIEPRTPRGAPA
jgi:CRISPR system Cascade subunit CasA